MGAAAYNRGSRLVEADIDDECLVLYCGDEIVARGERESADVIDRWVS